MSKYILTLSIIILVLHTLWSQSTVPYSLFQDGKYREAIEAAKVLIEQDERGNISSYAVMGWSYIALRQWKNALEIALVAETLNPDDVRIIQIIGEAYYQLNNDEKAKEYFSRYLVAAPQGKLKSWVYYFLGDIYKRNDQYHKAVISYKTALYLDEEHVEWWFSLADLYDKMHNIASEQEVYRKILVLDDNNQEAKRKLHELNLNSNG